MTLIETPVEAFCRSPAGRYTITPSAIIWCQSRSLCGTLTWGRPTETDTQIILDILDTYQETLGTRFDIVLDSRRVEAVDPSALAMLFAWLQRQHAVLVARVRMQASVIDRGPVGFLLSGLLPAIPGSHPVSVFADASAAFQSLIGEEGIALAAEIEAIAERVRGVPKEMQAVRTMLAANVGATIDHAANELGISIRSLQRILGKHGSSFKEEVVEARLRLAQKLLAASDDKLALIAARAGISERALTQLFRARTSLTPAEWRKRHRV
jgi:AraC-like DNA-binding protein